LDIYNVFFTKVGERFTKTDVGTSSGHLAKMICIDIHFLHGQKNIVLFVVFPKKHVKIEAGS